MQFVRVVANPASDPQIYTEPAVVRVFSADQQILFYLGPNTTWGDSPTEKPIVLNASGSGQSPWPPNASLTQMSTTAGTEAWLLNVMSPLPPSTPNPVSYSFTIYALLYGWFFSAMLDARP